MTIFTSAESVIQYIETEQAGLVRLYRSVPVTAVEQRELSNGWSVKDVLGHLAAWERYCADLLAQSHVSSVLLQIEVDTNSMNRDIYEEREEWSWEEIEYDFRTTHTALLQTIRNLPEVRLTDNDIQILIAENTWEHYAEHWDDMQRWHRRHTRNK